MFGMLHTVLGVILSQEEARTIFIDSDISKNSRTALLAAYIAELGIRHAKGPNGLGKTL